MARKAKKRVYSGKRTAKQINKAISMSRKAVAKGKIPPLKTRLKIVIDDQEMRIRDIIPKLKEQGWLPRCQDPSTYLCMVLSTEKGDFRRVERGVYAVKKVSKRVRR